LDRVMFRAEPGAKGVMAVCQGQEDPMNPERCAVADERLPSATTAVDLIVNR